MNRSRFHEILHENVEPPLNRVSNQNNIVFPIKYIKPKEKSSYLEEKDKVDVLYDLSYHCFYLSDWEKNSSSNFLQENIDISEIYVGDYQEKDIYYTNPLLEEK